MSAPTLDAILGPEEYRDLRAVAEQEGKSVEQLLRDTVRDLLRSREPLDLATDPSFGLWQDDPRSDDEMLADLGGC